MEGCSCLDWGLRGEGRLGIKREAGSRHEFGGSFGGIFSGGSVPPAHFDVVVHIALRMPI